MVKYIDTELHSFDDIGRAYENIAAVLFRGDKNHLEMHDLKNTSSKTKSTHIIR